LGHVGNITTLTRHSRAARQTCSCGHVDECRPREQSCQASRRRTGPGHPPTGLGPTRQCAAPITWQQPITLAARQWTERYYTHRHGS